MQHFYNGVDCSGREVHWTSVHFFLNGLVYYLENRWHVEHSSIAISLQSLWESNPQKNLAFLYAVLKGFNSLKYKNSNKSCKVIVQ